MPVEQAVEKVLARTRVSSAEADSEKERSGLDAGLKASSSSHTLYRSCKRKSRRQAPAFCLSDEGLFHQLATNRAERSDQPSAQKEQGGRLGNGLAAAADDVECAQSIAGAVGIPLATGAAAVRAAAGGIEVKAVDALAVHVPRFPSGSAEIGGTDDQEVILAGRQADTGNASDADQAAAGAEVGRAAKAVPLIDERAWVVAAGSVETNEEGVHTLNVANADIDLANTAGCSGHEFIRSGKAGAKGPGSGNRPTRAAVVYVATSSEVTEESCLSHRRQTDAESESQETE